MYPFFPLAIYLIGGSDSKDSTYTEGDLDSVPRLGRSLEEGMTIHSSILSWRIPWAEEAGEVQSMGLQRVRQDWVSTAQKIMFNYLEIQRDPRFLEKFICLKTVISGNLDSRVSTVRKAFWSSGLASSLFTSGKTSVTSPYNTQILSFNICCD